MSTYRNETLAIRSQSERTQQREHSVPLYLTSSFTFENAEHMRAAFSDEVDANIYSRYSNPNVDELLEKIAQLEGGEAAWATATGMAAVFTPFGPFLGSGNHIFSSRSLFVSTHKHRTWGNNVFSRT